MKSLLLSAYNHLEIADLPAPVAGPGEVLIRVAACGICGSDVHGYDGSSGRRIPPIVMGHEAAGTIAADRRGRARLRNRRPRHLRLHRLLRRMRVLPRGEVNLCDNRQVIGVSCGDYRRHGAFAEYVAVPQRILYRLPEPSPSPKRPCLRPSPSRCTRCAFPGCAAAKQLSSSAQA